MTPSRITLLLLSLCINMYAQESPNKFGVFDSFSEVGAPKIPCTLNYDDYSQTYRIAGSSTTWFAKDNCAFLWKKMRGNFIVQTQVKWSSETAKSHRKVGIMIRSALELDTTMIALTNREGCLYRKIPKTNLEKFKFELKSPADVLQVERRGSTFILSLAHFGETYQVQNLENIDLGDEVLAGLFVTSQNNDLIEQAEFSNTKIFNTAPETLVQNKDYLGSFLEVVNIETGHRQVLGRDKGSWQAPNWAPDGKTPQGKNFDGKTLIYNSEGILHHFEIATGNSTVLSTDFATNNNNNHVLSFDGKHIGISHHAKDSQDQSVVYTVPVTGGVPKRVTEKSPSYLHGWSPDNEFLIYTGQRNDDFDIYKIPQDGGEEIQLTHEKGLDDGAEYSPDGTHIYFCSNRTGVMQVWRMDPDGTNQTQLTFDELNNWFPHVSPDNKWLVFISFPKDVPSEKLPFYERVYIRLIPAAGGEPKVISYLYGGQGSLNVRSWSPDGKKIAFISNGSF